MVQLPPVEVEGELLLPNTKAVGLTLLSLALYPKNIVDEVFVPPKLISLLFSGYSQMVLTPTFVFG